MNRNVIILLILISLFGIIAVIVYGITIGAFEPSERTSEVSSEIKSEQVNSEVKSEQGSDINKDPNEGVNTSIPTKSEVDPKPEGDSEAKYDENGDLRKDSKYLDDDQDTVANYYDICPGVDDFSSECDTDVYESKVKSTNSDAKYDKNGDLRKDSKYLDEDGDTIANYYDICPGVDDSSNECTTDAYGTDEKSTNSEANSVEEETSKYDKNGDLRKDSKYLDEDGDTVANYYDICPGVDDFGSSCNANA